MDSLCGLRTFFLTILLSFFLSQPSLNSYTISLKPAQKEWRYFKLFLQEKKLPIGTIAATVLFVAVLEIIKRQYWEDAYIREEKAKASLPVNAAHFYINNDYIVFDNPTNENKTNLLNCVNNRNWGKNADDILLAIASAIHTYGAIDKNTDYNTKKAIIVSFLDEQEKKLLRERTPRDHNDISNYITSHAIQYGCCLSTLVYLTHWLIPEYIEFRQKLILENKKKNALKKKRAEKSTVGEPKQFKYIQ